MCCLLGFLYYQRHIRELKQSRFWAKGVNQKWTVHSWAVDLPKFSGKFRLCKGKDSKQYNFGSFKAYSFKGKRYHFRLTSVAQKRLCSNSLFSPLSSSMFRLRNLLSHSSICNTPPSFSCRCLSFTVHYTYTKRSCFMCGSYLRIFLSSHFVGIIILKLQLLFVVSEILNLSIYPLPPVT